MHKNLYLSLRAGILVMSERNGLLHIVFHNHKTVEETYLEASKC